MLWEEGLFFWLWLVLVSLGSMYLLSFLLLTLHFFILSKLLHDDCWESDMEGDRAATKWMTEHFCHVMLSSPDPVLFCSLLSQTLYSGLVVVGGLLWRL